MKNIFLSGGSSFIGRNLQEQLKYNFTAPTHKELDLTNTEAVNRYFQFGGYFDAVIHCATDNTDGELKDVYESPNMKMFVNLNMQKIHYGKLINIGSGAEYDKGQPIVNVNEDFKREPKDFYGLSKYIIGKYIESADNIFNLRCFGVWGKYEEDKGRKRFITTAIKQTLNKEPITVFKNVFFSYCYIDDLVKIIDWFINNESRFNTYNVGGTRISLLEIANKIPDSEVKLLKAGLADEYTCDDSQLRNELKFEFSDFDKCLKEYYVFLKGMV